MRQPSSKPAEYAKLARALAQIGKLVADGRQREARRAKSRLGNRLLRRRVLLDVAQWLATGDIEEADDDILLGKVMAAKREDRQESDERLAHHLALELIAQRVPNWKQFSYETKKKLLARVGIRF